MVDFREILCFEIMTRALVNSLTWREMNSHIYTYLVIYLLDPIFKSTNRLIICFSMPVTGCK